MKQASVVILKPTAVFINFLAKEFPCANIPDLAELKADPTAYTMAQQSDDEATLQEIERHFTQMFKNEIYRAIGAQVSHDVEVSFLDFLCCFKFEIHSQIVIMEPSLEQGHQLLRVKPRSVLLSWMKKSCDESIDFHDVLQHVNIAHLCDNATVLVKNFQHTTEIQPFVQHYYRPIFKAEMLRICEAATPWPEVDSFETFNRYFAVELHTQLVHLQ